MQSLRVIDNSQNLFVKNHHSNESVRNPRGMFEPFYKSTFFSSDLTDQQLSHFFFNSFLCLWIRILLRTFRSLSKKCSCFAKVQKAWSEVNRITRCDQSVLSQLRKDDKSCSRLKTERLLRTQVEMRWKKMEWVVIMEREVDAATLPLLFCVFNKTTMTSGAFC